MTKKGKIIAAIVVFFVIAAAGFFLLWNGDTIKSRIAAAIDIPAAEDAAKTYYSEKYGEQPDITGVTPYYEPGFFLADDKYSGTITVHTEDCDILWNGEKCFDDRQYNEICEAVKEAYFCDASLGEASKTDITVGFSEVSVGGYYKFTEHYFNGDIEAFCQSVKFSLFADTEYIGEKGVDYRNALQAAIKRLEDELANAETHILIKIKDPSLDLNESKYSYCDSARKHVYLDVPIGAEYMELLAGGYLSNRESAVYNTKWCDIDEYTAVSDDFADLPLDVEAYTFEATDIYNGAKAKRSMTGTKTDNVFILGESYKFGLSSGNPIFLRFDKEHYNINGSTIPLLVYAPYAESGESYPTYQTIGWQSEREDSHDIYDAAEYGTWFYADEEYMYLYIKGTAEQNAPVITFVQLEEVIPDKLYE
ncbi:MAG: hypothetical protein ACI4YB_03020 [Oscillospiraceae bacterium]